MSKKPVKPEVIEPNDDAQPSRNHRSSSEPDNASWQGRKIGPFIMVRPGGEPKAPQQSFALLWCVLGASLTGIHPIFAAPLMAYGSALLHALDKRWLALLSVTIPAAMYFGVGVTQGIHALLLAAISFCVGCIPYRMLTPSRVLLGGVLAAGLFAGADAVYAFSLGSDLVTHFRETVAAGFSTLLLEGNQSVVTPFGPLEELVVTLLPAIYFYEAIVFILFGMFGASLAPIRLGKPRHRFIASYDTPLWVVVLVIIAVLAIGASLLSIPYASIVAAAGVNILFCSRISFLLQGISIMEWSLSRRPLGCLLRIGMIFLAFWLETTLMVLTIFGLIDVWANFRKLDRSSQRLQ